jgi:hypothetical protein
MVSFADAEQAAIKASAPVAPPEARLPELPPNLKRCLSAARQKQVRPKDQKKQKQKPKADQKMAEVAEGVAPKASKVQGKSPSADDLVLAKLEKARKRDACARLLLQWYEKNVKSPPKVAAAKT